MIKIAICDDENTIVADIERILSKASKDNNIIIEMESFYSGEELEKSVNDGVTFDLIYLDIQMKGNSGIITGKNIRGVDENAYIIYVTGFSELAPDLFEIGVFDFIKKPICEERMINVFLKANNKICNSGFYFGYQYDKKDYKVQCKEILYFESVGRKIHIYLRNGEKKSYNGKLSDAELSLSKGKIPFIRVHQSYLINYHFIDSKSKGSINLENGKKLPISTERQKQFEKEYMELMIGEIDV